MNEDDRLRRHRAIEIRVPRNHGFQPHTPLGDGGEFDSIRRMLERWGPHARRIGDDAAVIPSPVEQSVVVSTDTSVENVHFQRAWLTSREIGYRAAASALSDLAAMGAQPLGILVAMAIPEGWRSELDALSDGIGEASSMANAPIIGGDLSRGSELSLTFTVLGAVSSPLLRSAARPGDHVFVTGRLGAPGAALAAFQANREPRPSDRERFARPRPRIREAVWLAEHGAMCAIDISDGLSGDLRHLAAASRVTFRIDLGAVPLVDGVTSVEAARSGEEYELIVTSRVPIDVNAFRQKFSLELTRIGGVEAGDAAVDFFLDGEGVDVPTGYLHFQ